MKLLLRALIIAFGVSVIAVYSGGCAFFNTLYNARKLYKASIEAPRAPDGTVNRSALADYDKVIEKCQHLITTYPNSKWVDDAILLMGKAFYQKGEFDDAITKFEELAANFPQSELNAEGQLYLGKSYIDKGEVELGISVLKRRVDAYPKAKAQDEALFLLGTNSIKIDQEEQALKYLEVLAARYPGSSFRLEADLEVADLYLERGEYDKALTIYDKLANVNLQEVDRTRYLASLSKAYVLIGRNRDALRVLSDLNRYVLGDQENASKMLLTGEAFVGADSIGAALETYKSVAARYPRSKFSAEANYRLGVLYQERLDSLQVAKDHFDQVSRQFAKSEYAQEAIGRSVSITKLERLRESLGGDTGEDKAFVQFDLAEVELFQFNNVQKALSVYQLVLDEYPDSDAAPKAAYAIAYIYDNILADKAKAASAYQVLVDRYPESQQAEYARRHLGVTESIDAQ